METENPKCIVARDRDGVFYEIPLDKAKSYVLPTGDIANALEFYNREPTGKEGLMWAKMTGWGSVA